MCHVEQSKSSSPLLPLSSKPLHWSGSEGGGLQGKRIGRNRSSRENPFTRDRRRHPRPQGPAMTDPAIIEAAARALKERAADIYVPRRTVEVILAAVTPLIEAAALERAAKVAEEHERRERDSNFHDIYAEACSAAIRALIVKDSGGGE